VWCPALFIWFYLLCGGRRAVGVERAGQLLRNGRSGRGLDRRALHQVNELAVAQNCNRGRGRRMAAEVAACLLGCFAVLTGEHCYRVVGLGAMLHRKANAGAHLAGGASTDRVHYYHRRSRLRHRSVYIGCGAGFRQACAGKLLAHGNHHNLWIHEHLLETANDGRLYRLYGLASCRASCGRCCSL
jgi:hypothetical protein